MRRVILAIAVVAAMGCSSDDKPTGQQFGNFKVAWTQSPPSLVVTTTDGRELLRTASAFLETRKTQANWEMQYGTFRWKESDVPWSRVNGLEAQKVDSSGATLSLSLANGLRATLTISQPVEGKLDLVVTPEGDPNRVRLSLACAASDHFLGFGSQADGVDHRGHKVPIWLSEPGIGKTNEDDATGDVWFLTGTRHAASYPLPTFLSNRGFAFLADTTHFASFDLCKANAEAWSVEVWDRSLKVSLFDGPAPAKAIERLTAEIGRQPLANDLAFAPWNDAIFGSDKVREVAQLLRTHRIPSGAIWTEDFRGGDKHGDDYRLKEEWVVDRTLYPDIEALSSDLHDQGFRFFAYHNTFLVTQTKIIEEARAQDVLVKKDDDTEYLFEGVKFTPTALVDLTHPKGRPFVKDALEKLIGYGFDGWMADFAEWMPADAKLANGGDAEAYHNEYARDYHATAADALKAHADANLSTSFSRSGTLRTAPYQPVVWAGDQWTSFGADDGLPTIVTMGLNFGLAGITTYGHDIAGYQNLTNGPSTKELFFRWTTVGALSPVMRTHHGTKASQNWWFGKDEETIAHFKRWAQFHTRLWPYLRAAAKEAFEHGMPIMRQLALAYPADEHVWTMKDQYLFGPSLLVAPVVTEGATSREVYLPQGQWLPMNEGAAKEGGRKITVEVPLTEAAIFAPPGAIIPMLPERIDTLMPVAPSSGLVTLNDVKGERTLLVFGGAAGTWTDLDGTKFSLTSSGFHEVTEVRVNGEALPACGGASATCADVDANSRRVVVRGENLKGIEWKGGGQTSSLTVEGALRVSEVTFRF
jgi:alpha-glucosidase (family GH31 glycosyl hydrolase)